MSERVKSVITNNTMSHDTFFDNSRFTHLEWVTFLRKKKSTNPVIIRKITGQPIVYFFVW